MAVWVCRADGVRYAVGAPCCPECGTDEPYEEGDKTMAKISREAGPSDTFAEPDQTVQGPNGAPDVIHGGGVVADAPGETAPEFEADAHGNATTNEIEAERIVANGTVSDVLSWVGDDAERADAALTAENARPTPRSGVTGPLTTIVDRATAADDGTGE